MNRPLLKVALLYLSGVLLGEQIPVPLALVLPAVWLVALGALLMDRVRPGLLAAAIFGAGLLNLTLHRATLAPDDLRRCVDDASADVTVRGVLEGSLSTRSHERPDGSAVSRTLARIRVSDMKRHEAQWQPASGRVAVTTAGLFDQPLWDGQAVEVEGVLSPPRGPAAPGLFDYRAYLRNLGIHYQLRVEAPSDWRLLTPRVPATIADRFGEWARNALALGLPAEDEPLRLLWAMTLGWQTTLGGEVSEPFMRSGTLHVFAISGLHVALLSTVFVMVLRVFHVPRGACGLVVIPLLWFYTAVTGCATSAVRSTVMMTVVIAGWSLRRPSDLLNSLAAAGFLILLWDPLQLFQAGFQLSFAVVLSLALVEPCLKRWSQDWGEPDPLVPEALRSPAQRRHQSAWRWLKSSLVTSLAAWIGSMPLVAHYFHLVTPVSLLANLAIVPVSSFALASNVASLLFAAWWPGLAALFNHSAWFFMATMIWLSQVAADLPGAWFHVRSPTWIGAIWYYGAWISITAGWLTRPKCRVWIGGALGILGLVWAVEKFLDAGKTQLTILPLAGGHAIYFDAPGKRDDVLVDCGNESSVKQVVVPFLRSQGVNSLPVLALSHGDSQHVGGASKLNEAFRIHRVWVGPLRFRSPQYQKWRQALDQPPGRVRSVQRGDTFGPWQVLHPAPDDRFAQADDGSLVLAVTSGPTRILLLGDLGKPGQAALLTRYPELHADVVVSGLPTKTEPLDNALLHTLRPQVVVIADAPYPATARASRALQTRLKDHDPPALFTRETGTITIHLDKRGWSLSGMNGQPGSSGGGQRATRGEAKPPFLGRETPASVKLFE